MINDVRAVTSMTDLVTAKRHTISAASPASAVGPDGSHGGAHHVGLAERHGEHHDRYAAVVAALIDVRPDIATARFDEELTHAISDGRVDAQTARTLRWWQRASVRAAESYATAVVPDVLAARDRAEAGARRDADDIASAWRAACMRAASQQIAGNDTIGGAADNPTRDSDSDNDNDNHTRAQSEGDNAEPHDSPIAELAAVRLLKPARVRLRLASATASASASDADHTEAIRAAFAASASFASSAATASGASDPIAPNRPADLVTTTVENQRKDRSHANPATSA